MIPDLEFNIIVDDENKLLGFLNDVHLKKKEKKDFYMIISVVLFSRR